MSGIPDRARMGARKASARGAAWAHSNQLYLQMSIDFVHRVLARQVAGAQRGKAAEPDRAGLARTWADCAVLGRVRMAHLIEAARLEYAKLDRTRSDVALRGLMP